MDEKTKEKKAKVLLNRIDKVFERNKENNKKDLEKINKILEEAKKEGLI